MCGWQRSASTGPTPKGSSPISETRRPISTRNFRDTPKKNNKKKRNSSGSSRRFYRGRSSADAAVDFGPSHCCKCPLIVYCEICSRDHHNYTDLVSERQRLSVSFPSGFFLVSLRLKTLRPSLWYFERLSFLLRSLVECTTIYSWPITYPRSIRIVYHDEIPTRSSWLASSCTGPK